MLGYYFIYFSLSLLHISKYSYQLFILFFSNTCFFFPLGKLKMLLVFLLSCLALVIAKDDVMCPDGKSLCASSYTCCLMPSGSYGCCPLPNAVCCNDRVHCCPTNYKCDLGSMTCNRDGRQIPMLKHRAAKNIPASVPVKTQLVPDVGRVICPGGK